jgi:hypothetical protein
MPLAAFTFGRKRQRKSGEGKNDTFSPRTPYSPREWIHSRESGSVSLDKSGALYYNHNNYRDNNYDGKL